MTTMAEPRSQQIVPRNTTQELVSQVRGDGFREQISAALPDNISVERFARITITALMEDTVKQSKPEYMLANADRSSFFQAAIRCAQDGLLPDGREAALVVFKGKVQYMPMVGGFRKIAAEYGWTLRGRGVRENDVFEYSEEPPSLSFRYAPPGVDRGELLYAFAIARHKDGRQEQRVMTREQVLKRRDVAKTKNVWEAWDDEMWAKTPEKSLFKELPLDPAEKERVLRVVAAADLDPAEATRALYGPSAAPALNPSPETNGDVSQHASGVAPNPPVASEAPGDTTTATDGGDGGEDGYNQPDGRETDPVVAAAREAGSMVPPSGQHAQAGRTLEEILILGEPGVKWFELALGKTDLPEPFRAALLAFARVHLPELYAQATFDDQIEF